MKNLVQEIEARAPKTEQPHLKAGLTVRVHQKIREGEKDRVQVFEGLIIKLNSGVGVNKTFTVRKVVDGIGVEKIFPINSPNVVRIEITKESRVRRAKLYFLREEEARNFRLYEKRDEEQKPAK